MSESQEPRNSAGSTTDSANRRHPVVAVVAVLLGLEAIAFAAVTVYLVVEIVVAPSSSFASAVGLAIIAALAAVWVAVMVSAVLRGSAWVRAASIVIQVLLLAVAVGSVQGPTPQPVLAIALGVPAIAVLVLVFTKPFIAATLRREGGGAIH